MGNLLIWFVAGLLGAVLMLAGIALGWWLRARFYAHPVHQALGIHVCVKCGEPMRRRDIRQADGRWLHPHCKDAA